MLTQEQKVLIQLLNNYINEDYSAFKLQMFDQIDIRSFMQLVESHKILPTIVSELGEALEKNAIFESYRSKMHCFYHEIDLMLEAIKEITSAANKSGISFLIIKGIILSYQIYGDIYKRSTSDIDLLMNEDEMTAMDRLLRDLKYEQYNDNLPSQTLQKPILKAKTNHEFYPYRKQYDDIEVVVEVGRNLHSRIKDDNISMMMENQVKIDIMGNFLPALCNDDVVAQLIENIFENSESWFNIIEGKTVLKDYLDLMLFIKKYSYEATKICSIIDKYNIINEAKLVFSNLGYVFQDEVCVQEISEYLSEKCDYKIYTYTDFWNKIFNSQKGREMYLKELKRAYIV